jgi:ribosomal-protein-alanine N-acetyltransferase
MGPLMTAVVFDVVSMTRGHLKQVRRIDALVYPQPWSQRLWLQELSREHRIYLSAIARGQVLGHVGVMISLEDAHVMTLVTDPAAQRRGVATRLMLAAVRESVEAGCRALTLEVRAANVVAQALYRRFGLAPVGFRRGYYDGDDQDAVVMWAHDIDLDEYASRLDQIDNDLEAKVSP